MFSWGDLDLGLWWVAWDGDEVAGTVLGAVLPTGGHVEILAVREGWRGRGLGAVLLLHSLRQLVSFGHERITLDVDAANVTGANRVYQRTGMRVCRETDFFEKELPATR